MWCIRTIEFDVIVNRRVLLLHVTTQISRTYSLGGSPQEYTQPCGHMDEMECALGVMVKEDFNLIGNGFSLKKD